MLNQLLEQYNLLTNKHKGIVHILGMCLATFLLAGLLGGVKGLVVIATIIIICGLLVGLAIWLHYTIELMESNDD